MSERIQLADLGAQRRRLGGEIERAISRVLDHGQFVMGPEVGQLESALAARSGARHVVSCASGTDALVMALMALGVGPGRSVLVPSFTFAATAEAVALLGGTPAFVDVDPKTFNIDPTALGATVEAANAAGLPPTGVIAVDLFGQPADYSALGAEAQQRGWWVLADAAQSFGAEVDGARVGTLAPLTTTSFFPAKPLGCYGDGGAVICTDAEVDALLRSIRVHGQGDNKYDNVRVGLNGRLDTLQAAILLAKLEIFDEELQARRTLADHYLAGLADVVRCPVLAEGVRSAWAQFTILVEDRTHVIRELDRSGIPTAIYYPRPLHAQPAYQDAVCPPDGLPVASELAEEVLSLPMHPYLGARSADRVIDGVRKALT